MQAGSFKNMNRMGEAINLVSDGLAPIGHWINVTNSNQVNDIEIKLTKQKSF